MLNERLQGLVIERRVRKRHLNGISVMDSHLIPLVPHATISASP